MRRSFEYASHSVAMSSQPQYMFMRSFRRRRRFLSCPRPWKLAEDVHLTALTLEEFNPFWSKLTSGPRPLMLRRLIVSIHFR